jgi:hypothetical protein
MIQGFSELLRNDQKRTLNDHSIVMAIVKMAFGIFHEIAGPYDFTASFPVTNRCFRWVPTYARLRTAETN